VHEEQAQGIRGRLLAVSRLVQVLRVIRIHEMDDETMHACCPCLLEMMRCMSRANAATTMNYYWVPLHAFMRGWGGKARKRKLQADS
jgi:hypothetical protein